MTDNLCSFSRQEAKGLGRLAQWKESHQANIKCARDIDNLIVSHIQSGSSWPSWVWETMRFSMSRAHLLLA